MQDSLCLKRELCREFPPELLLLLECHDQQPNGQQVEKIRKAAGQDLDWEKFLTLAERHRVIPHACVALSDTASDLIPGPALEKLKHRFQMNTRKNLVHVGELTRICRALSEAGIPLLGFKGPVLAMQMYQGLQCRQFKDLDLLVKRDQLVEATTVLTRLGYREKTIPLSSLNPSQIQKLLATHRDLTLIHEDRPVVLELHWTFKAAGKFELSPETLWQTEHCMNLSKCAIHCLPPREQLLFLAWHGGHHRWKRLSWLFDMAQALRCSPEFATQELEQLAAEMGIRKFWDLSLAMVEILLGLSFSHAAQQQTPALKQQMERSCHAIVASERYYEEKPLSKVFWAYQMSDTIAARAGALTILLRSVTPAFQDIHRSRIQAWFRRWQTVAQKAWGLLQSGVRRTS